MNVSNGTLTYAQKLLMEEEKEASGGVEYLIPKKLRLILNPRQESNETIPFTIQPQLQMFDALDRWVKNVGTKLAPWIVTASLVPGKGDPMARLEGNVSVQFINGTANFTNLAISHNGTGYQILYNVTYPSKVSFSVTYGAHIVKEREFGFNFTAIITKVYDATPFPSQPSVMVYDTANGEIVNTGWKNRIWYFEAELIPNSNLNASFLGTDMKRIVNGSCLFTNLSIDNAGNDYQIKFKVYTVPASSYVGEYITPFFNVTERLLYLHILQDINDCNDTVICGQQPIVQVRSIYPPGLAGNLGVKGRTWYLNVSLCSGNVTNPLLGTTLVKFPNSGEVNFTNLYLDYSTNANETLCFKAIVDPFESKFSNFTVTSHAFPVKKRKMFIIISTPPTDANETVVFGQQPVVDVHDMGTGLSAYPLRTLWAITVSLNKTINNGVLSGNKTANVVGTNATFTGLAISSYGVGFVLKFESNYGHVVRNY